MADGAQESRLVMRILELHTNSHPESLAGARREVRDAMTGAGVGADTVRDMELAVGEVLANVHAHAYGSGVGPVSIEVATTDAELTVTVCDEGGATEPPTIPRTLPSWTRHGGRGLYMASRLAEDVEIRVNSAGHGVMVRMKARLRPSAKPASRGAGGDGLGDRRPRADRRWNVDPACPP
jgi:anti-sigma regulatory factor (Ser/Thr protein kinase)